MHIEIHNKDGSADVAVLPGSLAILYDGLKPPELHIAVVRTSDRCTTCSLIEKCGPLFDHGKKCQIVTLGESWAKVPDRALTLIREVNVGHVEQ